VVSNLVTRSLVIWRCVMPDLIAPHGGLREPVDRMVPANEVAEFRKRAGSLQRVPVSDADLSSLYRIGDRGLSPLPGPMDNGTAKRVLDEEILIHNGHAYAWTIPIVFPVDKALAGTLKTGETVALVNGRDEVVGTLAVRDVFPFDRLAYIKSVYG